MGFWTTLTRSQLLHDAWRLDTYEGLIAAMVTAAILSILFEYIDIIKLKVVNRFWPREKVLNEIDDNSILHVSSSDSLHLNAVCYDNECLDISDSTSWDFSRTFSQKDHKKKGVFQIRHGSR